MVYFSIRLLNVTSSFTTAEKVERRMFQKTIKQGEIMMIGKKKISAIFAVLMLTISFLIAIPLPVSAAPADAKVFLSNFLWKYPNGTTVYDQLVPYLYYPAYGMPAAFNKTLNYPENADKLGALPILAVIVTNTTNAGFTMSSWEFGVEWNPEVLGYPVTFSPFAAPLGLPTPTIFESQYYTGNANYTAGTINIYHGKVSGYKMARNDSLSTTVTGPKVLCFIIPTVVGYGETLLDIATYVKIDDQGVDITPTSANLVNGYLKFRIHEVKLTPNVWVYTGSSYHIGDTLTVPINIITTEPVHTWELNMSYYGLTEYGTPTTPTISCSSTANVSEGNFLLLSNRTSPHGGNTFNKQVGPGWVWANGTYTVSSQYADAWSGATLMVINFTVLSYGKTILNVTQFSAKDPTGAEITPQPHFSLDEGLRETYFSFEKYVAIAPIFEDTSSTLMSWLYPAKTIGTTFNMNVTIQDTSQNVNAWKAGFRFNPKVLECLSVTEGPYLSSEGSTTWNPNIVKNNTTGEVYNITCTGDTGVYNSGYGILFYIEFNVTGYGRSLISFTDKDIDVTETKLQDNNGTEIRNPGGLYFALSIFQIRAPITVNMTMITPTHALQVKDMHVYPNLTFTVTLTIDTLEKVNSWQAGIHFAPSMMTCTSSTFGNFGATTPGMTTNGTDNINGYVTLGKIFYSGNYSTGSGTLATITFKVKDVNSSWLGYQWLVGPSASFATTAGGQPHQTVILDLSGDECTLNPIDPGVVIQGDLTANGEITTTDASRGQSIASRYMMQYVPMTLQEAFDEEPYCDVNGDGNLTGTDVTWIKNALNKLMQELYPWWQS